MCWLFWAPAEIAPTCRFPLFFCTQIVSFPLIALSPSVRLSAPSWSFLPPSCFHFFLFLHLGFTPPSRARPQWSCFRKRRQFAQLFYFPLFVAPLYATVSYTFLRFIIPSVIHAPQVSTNRFFPFFLLRKIFSLDSGWFFTCSYNQFAVAGGSCRFFLPLGPPVALFWLTSTAHSPPV